MKDLTTRIVEYEQGKLDEQQTIQLFQELIDSGLIMQLQGHYQRFASQLLQAGLVEWLTATASPLGAPGCHILPGKSLVDPQPPGGFQVHFQRIGNFSRFLTFKENRI